MSTQMTRLLQILLILPRYPRSLTTDRIQRNLENQNIYNDIRTIQRDMLVLEKAFRPRISNQKCLDKSVRWFWTKDAPVVNLSGLTINQALSLSMVKKYLTPLFPSVTLNDLQPFFDEAATTLQNLEENPLVEWPKKIAIVQPTQPLLPPKIDTGIQTTVSEALLADRQLTIRYRPLNKVEQTYTLNPLGLVLRGGVSYLIASKVDTNDIRPFVLHRMKSATQTEQHSIRPEGFDLQYFIDEGQMGFNLTGGGRYQPIQLKAIFDSVSIKHLYETRLVENQVIEKLNEEEFMITAHVQETEQLFWWLQSFGSRVEVLEPEALRKKMANSVKLLAKRYAIEQPKD
jgi:predicted DNA-binding transcriptional regulator YafY